LLEGFGPELLPWLEYHLPPPAEAPGPWVIFAQLVASHRHAASQPRILSLLNEPDIDLLASTLKALAALGDPQALEAIRPFIRHEAWPLRAQAARAMGRLGGPATIADLLSLTADTVYEVRRNAAQALADLGHAGRGALEWLAEDPEADRFARDIARERLEWSDERGHL
jgi:HEAT repeat protein